MVTYLLKGISNNGESVYEISGLSTDAKPLNVGNGSVFVEVDTGSVFFFDGEHKEWCVIA